MNVVQLQSEKVSDFDAFWNRYPRKVGRAVAEQKYRAITGTEGLTTRTLDRDSGTYVELTLKATHEEIMAGLKAYWDRILREDTPDKFIMHPSTWLNRGGWMDGT